MKKLLIIFLFTLIAEILPAQLLRFHQLTVKDGLPSNSVIALGQDKKGNIWIATSSGMCRLNDNGLEMISIEGLPDKRVDRINCADDGTMWVQCFENHDKVSRYDTLTGRFVTYDNRSLADSIRHQAVVPLNRTFKDPNSNRVWTVEKRMLWEGTVAYTGQVAIDAGLKDETIFSLLLDSNGFLWAGSANNGLFFADTNHMHYQRLACVSNPLVRALCRDSEGTLWFTGNKGLNALTKGKNIYENVDYPLKDSVEGVRIHPIIEDKKKRLWIGTYDGLYMRPGTRGRTFKRIEFQDTLRHEIYSLTEDDRQQLWIGTAKGLYCMMPDSSLVPQLVDSTLVHIIYIFTGEDYKWIASEKGLFRMVGDALEKLSDQEVHCVITDATGQTWVGTDNGLCRITGREMLPFSSPADGHIVKSMLYWHDFLWCCYDQGICCINIYTGKGTRLHTLYNEYSEGCSFLDANTGTLYFGGNQGIDCFVADSLEPLLRSGAGHIWLEEVRENLTLSGEEEESSVTWWLWFVVLAIVGIVVGGIAFAKSGRTKTSTKNDNENEKRKTIGEVNNEDTELVEEYENQEPVAPELSPFVAKATEFVNAHLADTELTAEMMAREMAMSRSKLFELMKQETGKAVMEFVRDLRLEYAARRLEAGDSVAEITYACGFSDPSSFRRAFTNKYGVTPSQYKTEHRKN